MKKIEWGIRVELILLAAVSCACLVKRVHRENEPENLLIREEAKEEREAVEVSADGNFIKWVDFNITSEALERHTNLTETPIRKKFTWTG